MNKFLRCLVVAVKGVCFAVIVVYSWKYNVLAGAGATLLMMIYFQTFLDDE